MFKRKYTSSDILLIAMNLVPLYGVCLLNWDPKQMFLIYCLETIIIGLLQVFKMSLVTIVKKTGNWQAGNEKLHVNGWFIILFFIVHYGLFVLIQMSIFFGVSGLLHTRPFGMFTFMLHISDYISKDSSLVLYGFIFVYSIRMVMDFIISGEYKNANLSYLMFQPYPRIFLQQFVVILGSMFLVFGAGKIFMFIFVVTKIWFELFINFDKILLKQSAFSK